MNILQDFKSFFRIKGSWYLIVGLFLYGIGTGILAPMNAIYMSNSIGLTKVQIATIFSASVLLNMVITISVGFISDQMQRKKPLPMGAALLCMVGLFIYMRADSFGMALVGMILAVAPSGLIMGQLFAMARNHFMRLAPDIFEIAQIWLRAMYSVGFFVGLLLGANLFLIASFRGILIGNLFGYLLLFGLLFLYREYDPIDEQSDQAKREKFSFIMLAVVLLLACADALRGLYLPLVIDDIFGRPEWMAYLWSVQAVFELLFMTFAGYWAMRFGSKRIILLSAFCALIPYIIYSFEPPLFVFFLVQPLYSFFVSVLYGVIIGYVQRMFHTRIGFGSSLYVFLIETAKLVGYLLPLFITGYTAKIFTIPALLVGFAILFMIALALFDRRKKVSPVV